VGAGPAGLTAAYYLAIEGYPVTVFEKLPVLGGMLPLRRRLHPQSGGRAHQHSIPSPFSGG